MQLKNPQLLEKLEKAGLPNKEALVYISTLELGGAFPSRIAEYSGLNRSTTYKILLGLSIRGVVNEIRKRNKLFYQIEKPDRMLRFAKDQVRLAQDRIEKVELILPDIEGLYAALGNRPKVSYYEGAEGLLAIYTDHVSVDKSYEMLAWANATELKKFLPPKFFDHYVKTKEKTGITTRGILPDTPENRAFTEARYTGIEKKVWPEMRFVKSEQFPFTGEITVYGTNKVSIANFEQNKMIGTIIEDEAIHRIMATIFNLSWESKLIIME